MLLSIGMMVKNEEKYLERCLKSLVPILENIDSELIIVDTGSEDNTVEIAKKYTKNIYFHEWDNDFSGMRNKTINYAKGEWFFVIDGDEVIESVDEIIEFFNSNEYKNYYSGSINLKNYFSSKDESKFGMCDSIRLFKNDGEFKYIGAVHNQAIYKKPTKKILSTIGHYGYINDDLELMEKKFIRTSNLLKAELEKNPDDIYYRYQLAVSYSMHGDMEEALDEITIAYEKINKYEKVNYKYILDEYADILLKNNKYKKCEEICSSAIRLTEDDELYKIDLAFYLAKCQSMQGDYINAIKSYNMYLKLLKMSEEGQLPVDLTIKVLTSSDRNTAYNDMAIGNYFLKNYQEVINNILSISELSITAKISSLLINSYINLNDYDGLVYFYEQRILNCSQNEIEIFESELEKLKSNKKDDELNRILERKFSKIQKETSYKNLNILRTSLNKEEKYTKYIQLTEVLDVNSMPYFYGELIYIGILEEYDVLQFVEKMREEKINEFLMLSYGNYKNSCKVLYSAINNKMLCTENITCKIFIMIICRVLMLLNELDDEKYKYVFNLYINNGIEVVKKIYSKYILENQMVLQLKNSEHEFMYYMMKVKELFYDDQKECVQYLSKALNAYPCMNKGIQNMLDELKYESGSENRKMIELKNMLIENIDILISEGRLEEAFSIIVEYEKIAGSDFNSLLYKSLILKNA